MAVPSKYVGLSVSDSYVEYLEKTIKIVVGVVALAEEWSGDQENGLPDGNICSAAMKLLKISLKERGYYDKHD